MDDLEVAEEVTEAVEIERERERENGLLAVARAAFDPARLARRRSILVDSVLRVLYTSGPLPTPRVAAELRRMFGTNGLSSQLVQSAIDDAFAAMLVERRDTILPDQPEWALRDDARRDLTEDAEWASLVLDRLDQEVSRRLSEDVNHASIKPDRHVAISTTLRHALAAGAAGLYAVGLASAPNQLRPLRFREQDALEIVDELQPRTVREAARRLLVAAMDPHDDFADEYLSMLAAANALHGLATGRDLSERGSLVGTRLLFDTSVIVFLADDDGPEAKAVKETIALTRSLGGEVIVAEHSIDEWRRLFDAADGHMRHQPIGGTISTLVDNPFIRAYGRLEDIGQSVSWSRYRAAWENPTPQLQSLGINVRPAGNHTPDDELAIDKLREAFAAENEERESQAHRGRGRAALECDIASAAMVARWRANGGPSAGFFIARDRMTNQAFRRVYTSDSLPMSVTPAAWALLVGGLAGDDPATHSQLAKLVANAAIADSFYSMAAGFSFEEVQAFSEALAGEAPELDDLHDFVQATFDDFENEAAEERIAQARLRGAVVRENRATRKDQRARRAIELADQREEAAARQGREEAALVASKTQTEMANRFAEELKDTRESGHAQLAGANDEAALWKRAAIGLAVLVALSAILWVGFALAGAAHGWGLVLAAVAQGGLVVGYGSYVKGRPVTKLVVALVVSVLVALGGLAVDRLTDDPGPARPEILKPKEADGAPR